MDKLIKSILATTGVLLVFVCNAFSEEGVPSGVLGTSTGRYVFGQISRLARDQYLLDTQTGRLWQVRTYDEKKDPALFPVKYFVKEIPILTTNGTDLGFTQPEFQLEPDHSTAPTVNNIKKK